MQSIHGQLTTMLLAATIALTGVPGPLGHNVAVMSTSCTETLVNGSFEAGDQGWTQSSAGGYDLVSDFNPFAGAWGAYLGGTDDADDRLSQAVRLPAGATSITLRAWWSIATAETGGGFDRMTLALHRPDGALLAELFSVDDSAEPDSWDEAIVDLTPFSGQEVILQSRATTDGSNPTDFYLDDIGIVACTAIRRSFVPFVVSTPPIHRQAFEVSEDLESRMHIH
jgi:hypothetical protein